MEQTEYISVCKSLGSCVSCAVNCYTCFALKTVVHLSRICLLLQICEFVGVNEIFYLTVLNRLWEYHQCER